VPLALDIYCNALLTIRYSRPQRGSFPLDHDGKRAILQLDVTLYSCLASGECKSVMMSYLSCMKKVKGVNEDECRMLAKSYLACRMDR
jgi:cytochrome c oxidase assembly protein subunit 19